MTEETKTTCECKENLKKYLCKFAFLTSSIFLGVLLAILLSAQILKPKCPVMRPGMMPPPPAHHQMMDNRMHHKNFRAHHKDFREHRFNEGRAIHKNNIAKDLQNKVNIPQNK